MAKEMDWTKVIVALERLAEEKDSDFHVARVRNQHYDALGCAILSGTLRGLSMALKEGLKE